MTWCDNGPRYQWQPTSSVDISNIEYRHPESDFQHFEPRDGSSRDGRRQLADVFSSPCEEISPTELEVRVDDDATAKPVIRPVACHHYDDDVSSGETEAPAAREPSAE